MPPHRVVINVIDVFFIIFLIANDVVMEASLPNVFSPFFITKSF